MYFLNFMENRFKPISLGVWQGYYACDEFCVLIYEQKYAYSV